MKLTKTRARKLAKNKRRTKRQTMKGGKILSEKLQKCGRLTTNEAYLNTLKKMIDT